MNIRTVLGDIPQAKGYVYSHEHLICVPPEIQKDRDLELNDYEHSLEELKKFKDVGGGLLVEATTLDYGRNATLVKQMSLESKVPITLCSGFNKALYFPQWVYDRSKEEITERLIKDITGGADGCDAKAGFVKTGSSYQVIHDIETKVLATVVKASNITNAPIWIHTEAGTMGIEILDLISQYQGDTERTVIGHSDRNMDPYYHLNILKRGAYIQFDGISKIKYGTDALRIELIKRILDKGYEDKLLISGDMGRKTYLHSYGGGSGFEFIITKFIPRLLEEGIPPDIIHKIFIKNPIIWLSRF
ncbi:MAG: phosphotriesterase family protein [Brevinema sp.]